MASKKFGVARKSQEEYAKLEQKKESLVRRRKKLALSFIFNFLSKKIVSQIEKARAENTAAAWSYAYECAWITEESLCREKSLECAEKEATAEAWWNAYCTTRTSSEEETLCRKRLLNVQNVRTRKGHGNSLIEQLKIVVWKKRYAKLR